MNLRALVVAAALLFSAQSVLAQTTVNIPAPYGQYAASNTVQVRVLDTEEKMTGFAVTVEVVNNSDIPIKIDNLSFDMSKDGYFQGKYGGSMLYGPDEIPPGQKGKIEYKASQVADEVMVKFGKPNWPPLKLRLAAEGGAATQVSAPQQPQQPQWNTNGNFRQYASNGYVRMRPLSTEMKMTGFVIVMEMINDSAATFNPYNVKYSLFKRGYSAGSVSGSSVYGAENDLPPGRAVKLEIKNSERVDQIQVTFPKGGWAPLMLYLR